MQQHAYLPWAWFLAYSLPARTMTDGMLLAGSRRFAELSSAFKSVKGESGEKNKHWDVPPLLPDFQKVPHLTD